MRRRSASLPQKAIPPGVDAAAPLPESEDELRRPRRTPESGGVESGVCREPTKIAAREHFWSPPYFAASAGGGPLNVVKEYIENQKRPA
jgi:REP element-mobilizing transposase RayT